MCASVLCVRFVMRGSRMFVRGGPTSTGFFLFFYFVFFVLVDECREDLISTMSGPSSARQRNAI